MKPGPATSAEAISASLLSSPARSSASARGFDPRLLGEHQRGVRREIAMRGVARRLDEHAAGVEARRDLAALGQAAERLPDPGLEGAKDVHAVLSKAPDAGHRCGRIARHRQGVTPPLTQLRRRREQPAVLVERRSCRSCRRCSRRRGGRRGARRRAPALSATPPAWRRVGDEAAEQVAHDLRRPARGPRTTRGWRYMRGCRKALIARVGRGDRRRRRRPPAPPAARIASALVAAPARR